MSSFGWVLLLVLLPVGLWGYLRLREATVGGDGAWPLYAKKPLTPTEQLLYFRLQRALPEHIVLAQVSLASLLGVRGQKNVHAWTSRISRLNADFAVCTKDAKLLAVIELDDATQPRSGGQRDQAKRQLALQSAGVRILRWNAKSLPDEAAIRTELYAPAVTSTRPRHSARPPAGRPPQALESSF